MSRAQQKAETRALLLSVARDAFMASGYEGVTFRDLAKVAGKSTGAFFASWKDKAALYAEATGRTAPDPIAFCERVAAKLVGTEHGALAAEAMELRKQLGGR